ARDERGNEKSLRADDEKERKQIAQRDHHETGAKDGGRSPRIDDAPDRIRDEHPHQRRPREHPADFPEIHPQFVLRKKYDEPRQSKQRSVETNPDEINPEIHRMLVGLSDEDLHRASK